MATKKAKPAATKRKVSVSPNNSPSGETGLKRSGGWVFEEFQKELIGENGMRIRKEMSENDPVIGAMLFAIDMFMRSVEWFIDEADDTEQGKENAKFLRECKDDMSHTWPDFISEINSMLPHGWSYFEILYKLRDEDIVDDEGVPKSKYNDGRYGWRKFEIRSQESLDRWEFDEEGGLRGMWQRLELSPEPKFVPITKSLLFRTSSRKNNPEGRSVLRNAYRPWYFKKRFEEIEAIGVERDLAGLPFAEVPAEMLRDDADEDDKAMLQSIIDLVKNVRRDEQEGVVWPQQWDSNGNKMYEFKLMNSGGSRQFSIDQIITRCEQRMAMVILADVLLLGNDSTGSFALSTSKSGMFQSTLSAWLDMIQDVLNNYAVPRLFRLNNIKGPYPKFRHDDVQHPSIADLATFVSALAGAGAPLFPDVDLENHFRQLAQLPIRKVDDTHKDDEDALREERMAQQIEEARAAKKTAKQPPQPGGPNVVPIRGGARQQNGAPARPRTPSTGRVKSKLPPQQRRRTAAVDAAENVTKRTIRVRRSVLEKIAS